MSDQNRTAGDKSNGERALRASDITKPAKTSASDLLKQVVSGAAPASVPGRLASWRPGANRAQHAAIAVGALALGTALGMLAAPKPPSREVLAAIQASAATNQTELTRYSAEIEKLGAHLDSLREGIARTRADEQAQSRVIVERLDAMQKAVDDRLAGWSATLERTLRNQTGTLTAFMEKAASASVSPTSSAAQPAAIKPEPAVTGSVAKPDLASQVVEGWALRDIYAGVAVIEDRKRRVIEVGRGDTIPGLGRVEAVERRGKAGVVVTRQGLITPQNW